MRSRIFVFYFLIQLLALNCWAIQGEKLFITVYQQDLALIEQYKSFSLRNGVNELTFDELSPLFLPPSLFVDFPDSKILNIKYQPGKRNYTQILQNNLNQRLLISTDTSSYEGYLKYIDHQVMIFSEKRDGAGSRKQINRSAIKEIRFPSHLPPIIVNPALRIQVETKKDIDQSLAYINFLTHGLSWQANYVGIVDDEKSRLEFLGWAIISNKTGIDFADFRLTLTAGDINLTSEKTKFLRWDESIVNPAAKRIGQSEKYTFHYDRPFSLREGEDIKIPLFDKARDIPFTKKYIYDFAENPESISVIIEFSNDTDNHLGLPLFAGDVLWYQDSKNQGKVFIGGGKIKYTPQNETVRALVGDSTDLEVKHITVSNVEIGPREREETYKIIISGNKNKAVDVLIKERIPLTGRITESSVSYTLENSTTAIFNTRIEPNEKSELNYVLRFKF